MGRWPLFVALVALGGCRQLFGLNDPIPGDASGSGVIDAPNDGKTSDATDGNGQLCVGATGWQVCVPTPTQPVSLPSSVDTESTFQTCASMQPANWSGEGQPHACFVIGTTITGGNVYATGQYPLVLVASDSITVTSIDVSSHGGGSDPGAGAGYGGCGMAGVGVSNAAGGGGGAGGTFMTAGGSGGTGNSTSSAGGMPTTPLTTPTTLHGGCSGGNGGDAAALSHGFRGSGGGAVYLVAANSITITSSINASGSYGGGAAGNSAGGGGGGSGGMIVLYAPSITVTGAKLVANGAGGGGGGDSAGAGSNGSNPSVSSPTTPAMGGAGNGGAGGKGYALGMAAGSGVADTGGGGGGGGGGGYIRSNLALSGDTESPAVDVR